MIRYCVRCIMPETKPDLHIDGEGVCSACRSFERRKEVDWDNRGGALKEIIDRYRARDGSNYDCIVPVSGGKDSTYQTVRMLELGMNPLCVTATTDKLSDIGRRGIGKLKRVGGAGGGRGERRADAPVAGGVRRVAGAAGLRPDRTGGDRAAAPHPVHVSDR